MALSRDYVPNPTINENLDENDEYISVQSYQPTKNRKQYNSLRTGGHLKKYNDMFN